MRGKVFVILQGLVLLGVWAMSCNQDARAQTTPLHVSPATIALDSGRTKEVSQVYMAP